MTSDPDMITGPILTITGGGFLITGYDQDGNPIRIDMTAGTANDVRIAIKATREGYIAALTQEMEKLGQKVGDLDRQVYALRRENDRLRGLPRWRRWWR